MDDQIGIHRSKHWIRYLHGGGLPKKRRIYTVLKSPRRPIRTHLQPKKNRKKTDSFDYMRTVGPSNIAHSGGFAPLRAQTGRNPGWSAHHVSKHIVSQDCDFSQIQVSEVLVVDSRVVPLMIHILYTTCKMIKILMYNSSALVPGDAARWQLFCNEMAYNKERGRSSADDLTKG